MKFAPVHCFCYFKWSLQKYNKYNPRATGLMTNLPLLKTYSFHNFSITVIIKFYARQNRNINAYP